MTGGTFTICSPNFLGLNQGTLQTSNGETLLNEADAVAHRRGDADLQLPFQHTWAQPIVFTVTIGATAQGPATGNVTFTASGLTDPIGTVPLVNGTATISTAGLATPLSVGLHRITVTYAGDGNVPASTAIISQTVSPLPTSMTLSTASIGQYMVLTATLSDLVPGVLPSSGASTAVKFVVGKTSLGSAPVSNGVAKLTIKQNTKVGGKPLAGQTVTATYTGSGGFGSSGANITIAGTTTTAVTASPGPSVLGQLVTFTASVSPVSGAFDDGGTVQFLVDGKNFGSPVAPVGGIATITDDTLTLTPNISKPHTITAVYSGDAAFSGSSGSASQAVSQVPTSLSLAASDYLASYGQVFMFAATVTPIATGPGIGTPTGIVTFYYAPHKVLGTANLDVGGVATFSTSSLSTPLPAGTYTITACFAPPSGAVPRQHRQHDRDRPPGRDDERPDHFFQLVDVRPGGHFYGHLHRDRRQRRQADRYGNVHGR